MVRGPVAQLGWSVRLIKELREIPTMDLKDLIPKKTSRGDEIIQRTEGNYISIRYERPRARPKQIKIKRHVDRDTFIVGVTIRACEGTKKRPCELEVSNSSEVIAQLFIRLLRELGLSECVRLGVHSPRVRVEEFERYWCETLGLDNFGKPIIGQSRGRKIKKEIIHIKIYSAVVREVFKYQAENLHQLL